MPMLWSVLASPVAKPRPQTAGDAHEQAQTHDRDQGPGKQASSRRVHAEKPSLGSRWLGGVLARGSCSEDSSSAACAAA